MNETIDKFQPEFDDYELLKVLNQNKLGAVFLARHEEFDVEVTLKVLRDSKDEEARKRLSRAARLLYSFTHPHIVAVRDFGRSPGGYLYFTMNYVPGRDLVGMLEEFNTLDILQSCAIMRQILSALDYAHQKGVLHRNLHLGSIVVSNEDSNPQAVLLGFGVAKVTEDPLKASELTQISAINPVGGLKGTKIGQPQYMAPELALETATVQTDIFSISVIFVEMLTGSIDWRDYLLDGIWASKNPVFFSKRLRDVPDLPEELEQLILAGLAYSPQNRTETAREYLKQLERFLVRKVDRESLTQWFGSIDSSKRLPDINEIRSREHDKVQITIQRVAEAEKKRAQLEIDKIRSLSSDRIARAVMQETGRLERIKAKLSESNMELNPVISKEDLPVVKENAIIRCSGVLSYTTIPNLQKKILEMRGLGHLRIILDFKQVKAITIDSLPHLVRTAKQFGGCHCFALANLSKGMRYLSEIPSILKACRIIEGVLDPMLFEEQMGIYEWSG
jgi:serine/threonine protein kinase